MIFGYARVSRSDQNLDRQLDFLKSKKCEEIITEKLSGTIRDRPGLDKLLDKIREGDTIIVESFSRLGRSLKDLLEIMDLLNKKKVMVISQKENFDTTSPHGKLMLILFQAFSQFERDLIRERTMEGLAAARARGRNGGRPACSKSNIERALKMYDCRNFSISEICKTNKISVSCLYRYIRLRKNKTEEVTLNETA